MRHFFTDTERLKRKARRNVEGGLSSLRRWWCKKYGRPPSDPLFQKTTTADLTREMYEDMLERRAEMQGMLDRKEGVASKITEAMGAIDEIMTGVNTAADDYWNRWEEMLANGETPDWDFEAE